MPIQTVSMVEERSPAQIRAMIQAVSDAGDATVAELQAGS